MGEIIAFVLYFVAMLGIGIFFFATSIYFVLIIFIYKQPLKEERSARVLYTYRPLHLIGFTSIFFQL